MNKYSFFSNSVAGMLIKLAVTVNTAVLFFIVTFPSENIVIKLYWPWLIISTPIVLFLLWMHYRILNTQHDKLVSDVLISDHSIMPTALYLRPFVTDGSNFHPNKYSNVDTLIGFSQFVSTIAVFEGRLLSVIRKKYIPIKFDQSAEESAKNESKNPLHKINTMFSYRFGRHFDNTQEWRDTVRRMIKRCALCIIIPPGRCDSSTAEEIEMALKSPFLEKLVFIMPTKRSKFKTEEGAKVSAKQIWENLLQVTKDKIQLPNYSENGGFVLPINGRMTLIESCHGFDWSHKKAMKRIFTDGKLTCSKWQGALRVTIKLVWLILPLSVIYAGVILYALTSNSTSGSEDMGALWFTTSFVIFLLHMKAFYRFCGNFLLTKIRAIGLFVCSVVSLAVGTVTAIYLLMDNWEVFLIDKLGLNWIITPELGSNDYALSYILFGVTLFLGIVSIFVYLTACLFFFRQQNIEFRAVSQTNKNQEFTTTNHQSLAS